MCLSTLSLNMNYDAKEDAFVGIGYKVIDILDKNGNINWAMSKFLKPNIWSEASGDYEKVLSEKERFKPSEFTDSGKPYWPGFHIFLDVKNAMGYCSVSQLVEVKFKEVTCFGKNHTERITLHYSDDIQANCVIARYAKVTKILSRRSGYYNKTNGKYPKPYRIYED